MELELLLEREPWPAALAALQSWGALALLDPRLQGDPDWRRRLTWGHRLASALAPSTLAPSTLPAIPLPATAVLFTAASQPLALAERLQLPHRQHKLLAQWLELHRRLAAVEPSGWSPSRWCELLEAPGISADAVALALVAGAPAPSLLPEPALLPDPALVAAPAFPVEPALPARAGGGAGRLLPQLRRPLLRGLLDWRQVRAPITAADLISAGMRPGPALGARLRRERALHLDRRRF
jgi:poly(A) polymerase